MTRGMIRVYGKDGKLIITTYQNCGCSHDFMVDVCLKLDLEDSDLKKTGIILSNCDGDEVFNVTYLHKVNLEKNILETFDVFTNWDKGTHGFPRTPIKTTYFGENLAGVDENGRT